MKNKKITRKITLGMYILTTKGGGCIVDAVSQISAGDNPLIAVSVMKSNNTNILLKNNNTFALSVLGKNTSKEIINIFGFKSSKDIDKFANINTEIINDINIITDSLGYMICEKIDTIENDTHTLFIGRLVEADVFKDDEPMSYNYYQEHKEEYIYSKENNNQTSWVCSICDYVHHTEELPEDFQCPICGVNKDYFDKK